jgi:hypothetical protein
MRTPADVALVPVLRCKELATYALCDRPDHAKLMSCRWRLHPRGYAVGCIDGVEILMHRYLLGLLARDPREGDHINRNKLDNRRCNLRIVSRLENSQNHPGFGGTSEFRGVHRLPNGRFEAKVRVAGRLHHVGYFDDELEAARAAEAYRLKHLKGARPELDGERAAA